MSDKRLIMGTELMQMTLKWKYLGQECRNIFYFEGLSGSGPWLWDNALAQDVMTAFLSSYSTNFIPYTAHDASLYGIDWAANTAVGTGPLIGGSSTDGSLPVSGSEPSDGCANNVTLAIRLQTALLGRSNHGRFYMVGINSGLYDATNPNELKPGSFTNIVAGCNALQSDMSSITLTGGSASLVVASFFTGGSLRTQAVSNGVQSINLADGVFDSQRRRLPGRGI